MLSRRFPLVLAAALALPGLAGAQVAAAPTAPVEPRAHGLIVQLRDAPSHQVLREAPQSVRASRETQRWQRVLKESDLDRGVGAPSAPQMRPTGRAAQLMQFSRALGAAEAEQLAERLRARADVAWVTPNYVERRLQVPSDPRFGNQWWLQMNGGSDANVQAQRLRGVPGFQSAWQRTTGVAAARVAVLDSGITNHPELSGRVLDGYDFVSDPTFSNDGDGRDADESDPGDFNDDASKCEVGPSSWHGTIIAGMVAAVTNNSVDVAAMNWAGQVVPVRVSGRCGATIADIVDGMRWAAGLPVSGVPANPNPARIISLSFGGTGACTAAYQSAIDDVRAAGAVVIVAGGNEHTVPTRPANCNGTIGVTALNRDGFKTHYSNFGPEIDIATVGGDDAAANWTSLADDGLWTIGNAGDRAPGASAVVRAFGTSFAAPVVAGAVSLMLSANPALSVAQIEQGLSASARPHVVSPHIGACSASNPGRCICSTSTCGAGILDVDQAVAYAQNPSTYVAPARTPAVIDNPQVAAAAATGQDRAANPSPAPAPDPVVVESTGGGTTSPFWLAALLVATLMLRRAPRR